jgi:hypothetical protein
MKTIGTRVGLLPVLLLTMLGVVCLAIGIALAADKPKVDKAAPPTDAGKLKWDKTFPQSDKVTHQKVSYSNRLGIVLVGDLYIPKGLNRSKKQGLRSTDRPYSSRQIDLVKGRAVRFSRTSPVHGGKRWPYLLRFLTNGVPTCPSPSISPS